MKKSREDTSTSFPGGVPPHSNVQKHPNCLQHLSECTHLNEYLYAQICTSRQNNIHKTFPVCSSTEAKLKKATTLKRPKHSFTPPTQRFQTPPLLPRRPWGHLRPFLPRHRDRPHVGPVHQLHLRSSWQHEPRYCRHRPVKNPTVPRKRESQRHEVSTIYQSKQITADDSPAKTWQSRRQWNPGGKYYRDDSPEYMAVLKRKTASKIKYNSPRRHPSFEFLPPPNTRGTTVKGPQQNSRRKLYKDFVEYIAALTP